MLYELGDDDLELIGAGIRRTSMSVIWSKWPSKHRSSSLSTGSSERPYPKARKVRFHVEPYEKVFRVRFRIDGALYEFYKPPLRLNPVVSRLKIMSRLDISERRVPDNDASRSKSEEAEHRLTSLRVSDSFRRKKSSYADSG